MTFQDEIAAMQSRIARVRSERDTWRASGRQEKYLEAYCRVEALELELDRLRQRGLVVHGPGAAALDATTDSPTQ